MGLGGPILAGFPIPAGAWVGGGEPAVGSRGGGGACFEAFVILCVEQEGILQGEKRGRGGRLNQLIYIFNLYLLNK